MKVSTQGDEQFWLQIAAHTSAGRNSAPWPVQLQVAAVLGQSEIAGSQTHFDPVGPSLWKIYLISDDGRFIFVSAEFDDENYDAGEERQYRQTSPTFTLHEASVRRLNDVVRLDIGEVSRRKDAFGAATHDQVDVAALRLKFRDGTDLDLSLDLASDRNEAERADTFLAAVRAHTKL